MCLSPTVFVESVDELASPALESADSAHSPTPAASTSRRVMLPSVGSRSQVLLVIVRPMTGNPTKSTPLPLCMALFGRLSVGLYAILSVDQLWCSWVLTLHVYTC